MSKGNILRHDEGFLMELSGQWRRTILNQPMNLFADVIFERFKFNSVVQKEGQQCDSFHTELRKAVKTTKYTSSDEMVRDRVEMGIWDKTTHEKLLREPNLTLKKAVDLCRATEISKTRAKALQNEVSVSTLKRKRTNPYKAAGSSREPGGLSSPMCRMCGYLHKKAGNVQLLAKRVLNASAGITLPQYEKEPTHIRQQDLVENLVGCPLLCVGCVGTCITKAGNVQLLAKHRAIVPTYPPIKSTIDMIYLANRLVICINFKRTIPLTDCQWFRDRDIQTKEYSLDIKYGVAEASSLANLSL
ncbi:hypothetical protein HUJ05_003404 [Dendroctonus ponderosae]|nr:hypothetical protein HUJ05_003404 [Dendroctonus ponderosae]